MRSDHLEAMNWQAERMKLSMHEQIGELFPEPSEDQGYTVNVTGFVFRTAVPEDFEDEESEAAEAEDVYVFEAHFLTENSEHIGNLTSVVMVRYEGCFEYEHALEFFTQEIKQKKLQEESLKFDEN